ncbi:MAG: MarR family transcriptional regulator [Nitrosarchaeum sp.]|nr:MarR family transcriptional regulator [Nitrosarchaeum sp.]
MSPEIVLIPREEPIQEDGMIFVRTDSILETMVKTPLIVAGLIIAIVVMPLQTSFSSTRSLELTIYSDGSTHVSSKIDVDPLEPDFELDLFGQSIDNFVATGDSGFLLSEEIVGNKAIIDKFGSSSITIDYDIHDLISKEGRVWTFSLNSTSDYALLMPKNSVIVGMSGLPNNMEVIDEKTKLDLSAGLTEINYIFTPINPITHNPSVSNEFKFDYNNAIIIGGPIIAAMAGIILILKRKQSKPSQLIQQSEPISEKQTETKSIDVKTIFDFRPEMRDDDKEIVKFISDSGGQVLESELRKKFLQPRTTMWRAVKRLERLGVIEIDKKDLQNLVKLKKDLEKEE